MPCLYCRKMCCLNGSRKLHFVQKIRLDRIIKYLGPEGFFAHLRIFFCRYWTCSFSGRNNQAIGPRLSAIFTFFYIPILFAEWQWKLRQEKAIRSLFITNWRIRNDSTN